jgi:hypothetical protein
MLLSITALKMTFGTDYAWQLISWIFAGALTYVSVAVISDRWFDNQFLLLVQQGWKAR